MKTKQTPKGVIKGIESLMAFMRSIQIPRRYFFMATFFSFLALVFQLLEVCLLFPFLKGIITHDFSFTKTGKLAIFLSYFPQDVAGSYNGLFFFWVLLLFLVALGHNAFYFFSNLILNQQIRVMLSLTRKKIFARYLSFGKMFYDRNNVIRLNNILINHTAALGRHLKVFHQFSSQILLIVGYSILLFWMSWKLALVAFCIFISINFATTRLVLRVKQAAHDKNEKSKVLDLKIFNILSCIPLVKVAGRESDELERFEKVSDQEVEMESQMNHREELIQPIENLSTLFAILLLALSIPFVLSTKNVAHISTLLVFFFLIRRIVPAISLVSRFQASIAKSVIAVDSVLGVLRNDDGKHIISEGTRDFGGLQKRIEFKNLVFAYRGSKPVFENISFEIEGGKITALVGATGIGKTTLAHLLLRLYDCPPQSIFIDGVDIRDFKFYSLRKKMALVSQDILLFHDSIKNNLTYECEKEVSGEEIQNVLKKVRLDKLIAKLPEGVETVVGDRGLQLSGGERQRVALARAILKQADFFIFDEATSALDSKTEKEIQESIQEVVRGKTALIIAHRLSTVKHADQIIVLEEGKISEKGTPNQLLDAKGRFYQYWQEQGNQKV